MKGLILILAQLVAGWPVLGQAPGSDAAQVLLAAPPPAPVVSANAQTIGNRGSRVFFYWIVANFPVGKSVPYGPAQVSNVADTLTGGNYVRVVWSPVTGATSYDVLRTTTAVLPNGAANIAVATSVSGTLYDNASETINSYTVSSASTASGFWSLDNRGYSLPVMTFSSDPIVPTFIGTTLPSACVVGQKFFKTDATAGANLYLCTSTNVWTVNGSSGVCADCVLGASNITTGGRMVGVLSSGTVTEYSDFIRTAAGRYQIYDSGGSGVTTLTVRAGAGQSTTDLLRWLNGAGSTLGRITFAGLVDAGNAVMYQSGNTAFKTAYAASYFGDGALTSSGPSSPSFMISGATVVMATRNTGVYGWAASATDASGALDLGLTRASANNLAVTNGSSTNYWLLGAAGIQCGSGDGNSAACDVGTTGARVRNVNAAGTVTAGTNSFAGNGFYLAGGGDWSIASTAMKLRSDSTIGFANGTNATGTIDTIIRRGGAAGMLVIGDGSAAASSSYPALKRSTTELQAKLADDSAFTTFTSSNLKQGSGSPEGVVSGVVGDIYQNTTGGTGTSAYIKESGVGTTGWVAIAPSSGGTGLFQTLINDLRPTITVTTLTLDAGRCWGANKVAATAVITAGAGNGSFVAYCTDSQTLVVEDSTAAGLTITCTNCTRIQVPTPQVPEGLYPVATGTITTGQWTAVTDTRDFTTRFRFQNGTGMATTVVGSVVTEAVDPVQVQMTANDYDVVTRLDATASTSSAPAKTGTSLPGTCIVGDQYFKSDETAGGNLYGCTTGNTWTKVGSGTTVTKNGVYMQVGGTNYLMPGMYPATLPNTTGKSYVTNAGTATATTTSTGNALKLTLTTGTNGWRPYGKTRGAVTKLTVAIACPGVQTASGTASTVNVCGVGFRDSATNRLQGFRFENSSSGITYQSISNYSDVTTFSANSAIGVARLSNQLVYIQIEVTGGTTCIYRISPDGTNWTELLSDNTYLATPDQIWVGGMSDNTSGNDVLVYSWLEE